MATETRRDRLDPGVFDLPVEKMREGYYTDQYFNHTRAALLSDGRQPRVVMQVFQKNQAYVGGMDEAIAILKLCAVVGGELTAPQGERGRPDREQAADELLGGRAQPRLAHHPYNHGGGEHRRDHAGTLERKSRLRKLAAHLRDDGERLDHAGRPAQERRAEALGGEALLLRDDFELAGGGAHRAGPTRGTVDEHAIGKRHSAEPDLLRHPSEAYRRSSS